MTTLRDRADAASQVLVADLDRPSLDEGDRHHLTRVLRLKDGERVVASDGHGAWRMCRFVHGGELEPLDEVHVEPPPTRSVAVWLPALKGDRAEWAVAKLTELGVDELGLLTCARASVRPDAAALDRVLARWRRVAREASCQSRRTRLPVVVGPRTVAEVVAEGGSQCDLDGDLDVGAATTLLVGPEGGWDEAERPPRAGAVSLGATVLRTETAALCAGVLLCAARHDAVREAQ